MSKEKVDAYREQKKHRKENLAKERAKKVRTRIVTWVVAAVIVVGIVGALVLTGYNQWKSVQAAKPDYTATTQLVNDYAGVTAEDEAPAEGETEAAQ